MGDWRVCGACTHTRAASAFGRVVEGSGGGGGQGRELWGLGGRGGKRVVRDPCMWGAGQEGGDENRQAGRWDRVQGGRGLRWDRVQGGQRCETSLGRAKGREGVLKRGVRWGDCWGLGLCVLPHAHTKRQGRCAASERAKRHRTALRVAAGAGVGQRAFSGCAASAPRPSPPVLKRTLNHSRCAHLALGQPGLAPPQPPCWLRWAALHASLCAGQCAFWHSRLQGVGQEGGEAIGCCEQAGRSAARRCMHGSSVRAPAILRLLARRALAQRNGHEVAPAARGELHLCGAPVVH